MTHPDSALVVDRAANPQQLAETQLQIDFTAQRDEGIARAEQHAEAVDPGWKDVAYGMLEEFCLVRRGCHFTSEDVRRWCELRGFASPVPKAWGHVMLRAARAGLIVKQGYTVAKQRHGSPCPQWSTK